MACVLVNTYRHCKLPYLYTTAFMLFISPVFQILAMILVNWYFWCSSAPEFNDKCSTTSSHSSSWYENIWLMYCIFDALNYCFYHIGHWLFAFRYFEVAEMFGREDKSMEKHISIRNVTRKISYAGIMVIIFNYLINIGMWISR